MNLTENIWIKVAAVLLAVSMWLFVMFKGQTEISIKVPVQLENIPEGIEIVRNDTKDVVLVIRGHERFMRSLTSDDVQVMVDLNELKKGRNSIIIEDKNISLPRPLTLVSVTPTTVKITAAEKPGNKRTQ